MCYIRAAKRGREKKINQHPRKEELVNIEQAMYRNKLLFL